LLFDLPWPRKQLKRLRTATERAEVGVGENFLAFRNNYLIDAALISSISARYRRITRQLNETFWGNSSESAHSLYIGSYGRDTAAKGVSDLDMYFRLPYETYQKYDAYRTNGQSALLQAVRSSLQVTYPSTSLKGDGQVVVVRFTDGITFEVLPVFKNEDDSVTFPDSNNGGQWRTCNPSAEMEAFLARNKDNNHNLKAICRMMRIWKEYNYVPVSGMLIDTLAYNFIDTWDYAEKSYLYHDWLVRDFLFYVSQCDKNQDRWIAPGSGSWVRRSGSFEGAAALGYDLACDAIEREAAGNTSGARAKWRSLFGSTYP
jgi:hypothetical protein